VRTRVNSVKFGDGYEQRVADGINSIIEDWSLSFTLRTKAEINAIDAFLRARKGVENFDWTTPAGQLKKFVCRKWSVSYFHDGNASLSATFEQDFGV
jgi:phage-related protein